MSLVHGKTKIELYNPNTKIKEIIRSENTFQGQYLAKYFRTLGRQDGCPFRESNSAQLPLWQTGLGGIFLFKNSIPAGTQFMPPTNEMTGNGAVGVSNSSDVTELGSYNSAETTFTNDELSIVYDFATNQSVGTIGCVCLTSRCGGFAGYGNKNNKYFTGSVPNVVYDLNYAWNTSSYHGDSSFNKYRIYYKDYYWGATTYTSNSKKYLRIWKERTALETGTIFDGAPHREIDFNLTDDYPDILTYLNYQENYDLFRYNGYCSIINNKIKITFDLKTSGLSQNQNFYYIEFDMTNETLTLKSVVYNSNVKLSSGYNSSIWIDDTKLLIPSYNSPYQLYILDLTTGTIGNPIINTSDNTVYIQQQINFNNGLVMIYDSTVSLVRGPRIFFPDGTYKKLNGRVSSLPDYGYWNCSDDGSLFGWQSGQVVKNPFYLATINNLETPVTKTNQQTMKVTYTLTEV